jgi:formyl-CoA transferase
VTTKAEFYRHARTDLTGPLDGVRVLEATTTAAGPLCSATLADLGADVIKVEVPTGEVNRHLPPFYPGTNVGAINGNINRNKRSLSLDLRKPQGRDLFLRIAAKSDIVVENFKKGTMAKWGVGYEDVRKVKPDIVYVSITGWGQFGPNSNRAGYDPIAQAASGWMSMNGGVDAPPVKAATAIGDETGGLNGAIGAMAALLHRNRTGEGQHVDISLLEGLVGGAAGVPLSVAAMGLVPQRLGNEFGFAVPANSYRCKDGWLYIAVLLDSHWKALAPILGHPDMADDPNFAELPKRLQNRDACNAIVAAWAAERTRAEALDVLLKAGLAVAPVNTYNETAVDPHIIERDVLQPARIEDGSMAIHTGPVAKFSRTPTRVRIGAPSIGQHNNEILSELGIDSATQDRLEKEGVI